MTIVVGQISTTDGLNVHYTAELSPDGRGATEYRHIYNSPATAYKATQPFIIPATLDHDGPFLGEVRYLALRGLGLFGVLDIDDDVIDDLPFPMYLSSELEGRYEHNRYSDITLNGVAIVDESATIAKQPALVVRGDLDDAHLYHANPHRQLLKQAREYDNGRRFRGAQPHRIAGAHDVDRRPVEGFDVPSHPDYPLTAPRSNSGRFKYVDGQRLEIQYSAPYAGIINVR